MAVRKKTPSKRKPAAKPATHVEVAEQWSIKHRPRALADFVISDTNRSLVSTVLEGKKRIKTITISGQSGTGKSSLAYLIADALTKGSKADFIDLNCAESGTIDDIRNVIKEAAYLPAKKGGKRVILLDEIQALAVRSSAPLLKVLENPEPHVVWLLCTDQPGKILPTIRSRGMHIQLSAPRLQDAAGYMLKVMKAENATPEGWKKLDVESLVLACAKAADGNLRSALNLLEPALASIDAIGCKTWKDAEAANVLPSVSLRVPEVIEVLFDGVRQTLATGKAHYGVLHEFNGLQGIEVIDGIIDVSTRVLLGRHKGKAPAGVYVRALGQAMAARDAIMTVPASAGYRESMARALAVAGDLLRHAVEKSQATNGRA